MQDVDPCASARGYRLAIDGGVADDDSSLRRENGAPLGQRAASLIAARR